jgi:hypothetical protein
MTSPSINTTRPKVSSRIIIAYRYPWHYRHVLGKCRAHDNACKRNHANEPKHRAVLSLDIYFAIRQPSLEAVNPVNRLPNRSLISSYGSRNDLFLWQSDRRSLSARLAHPCPVPLGPSAGDEACQKFLGEGELDLRTLVRSAARRSPSRLSKRA